MTFSKKINKKGIINCYFLDGIPSTTITINKSALLYYAFTYGYRNLNIMPFGLGMRRLITVYSFVCINNFNSQNHFVSSIKSGDFDSTEIMYSSYVLGMTIANMLADLMFGYNPTIHFHYAFNQINKSYKTKFNNREPDLFASRSDSYIKLVMEAKGKSGKFVKKTMTHAINQLTSNKIDLFGPTMRIASQVYFNKSKEMEIMIQDPVDNGDYISLNYHKIVDTIYNELVEKSFKFIGSIKSYVKFNDLAFVGSYIPGTDYFIGRIYKPKGNADTYINCKIKEIREVFSEADLYIGKEGILVFNKKGIKALNRFEIKSGYKLDNIRYKII